MFEHAPVLDLLQEMTAAEKKKAKKKAREKAKKAGGDADDAAAPAGGAAKKGGKKVPFACCIRHEAHQLVCNYAHHLVNNPASCLWHCFVGTLFACHPCNTAAHRQVRQSYDLTLSGRHTCTICTLIMCVCASCAILRVYSSKA